MKWDRLDELLALYMTPAMVEAGFAKCGTRSYAIESPAENLVLVEVRGQSPMPMLSFFIAWAAIPSTLRAFHSGSRGARPRLEWGLFNGRLESLPEVRLVPEMKSDWRLDPNREFDSFGRRFEQALRSEAIPMWIKLLDRDHLVHRKGFGYYDGPGLREAILYVDDADPRQVSRWIDQAGERDRDPDDTIVDWLRQRLAARISS